MQRVFEASDQSQQRGFAAAAWSKQGQRLARSDVNADIVEYGRCFVCVVNPANGHRWGVDHEGHDGVVTTMRLVVAEPSPMGVPST